MYNITCILIYEIRCFLMRLSSLIIKFKIILIFIVIIQKKAKCDPI